MVGPSIGDLDEDEIAFGAFDSFVAFDSFGFKGMSRILGKPHIQYLQQKVSPVSSPMVSLEGTHHGYINLMKNRAESTD